MTQNYGALGRHEGVYSSLELRASSQPRNTHCDLSDYCDRGGTHRPLGHGRQPVYRGHEGVS